MAIVLTRIDNRLLHGVVATQWAPSTGCTRLMVIDNEVADDPQKKVHARKFRRQQIEHVQKALLKFEGGWSFNGNFQHCLSKRK